MQLLFLLGLLTGPFLVLTLLSYLSPRFNMRQSTRARIGLSLFFLFTGTGHFIRTEPMAAMLPPSVHYRVELIYLTGVFELLGAVGVWIPKLVKVGHLSIDTTSMFGINKSHLKTNVSQFIPNERIPPWAITK